MSFTIHPRYPDPSIEVLDDAFFALRLYSASVEQLATGLRWAEGRRGFGVRQVLIDAATGLAIALPVYWPLKEKLPLAAKEACWPNVVRSFQVGEDAGRHVPPQDAGRPGR